MTSPATGPPSSARPSATNSATCCLPATARPLGTQLVALVVAEGLAADRGPVAGLVIGVVGVRGAVVPEDQPVRPVVGVRVGAGAGEARRGLRRLVAVGVVPISDLRDGGAGGGTQV